MTERAGRMPEETGDDDAAELGVMESPAEGITSGRTRGPAGCHVNGQVALD